jgi:DNA-binding CsgD family transcriptional regulator
MMGGMPSAADQVQLGRMALTAGDWSAAREAFTAALAAKPSADALDGLGIALWWLRDVRAAIEARTRAYAALRRERRIADAIKVAVWLAREHRSLYRNQVVANGWLARARSAAEQCDDAAALGWLSLAEAEFRRSASTEADLLRAAVATARRYNDVDLEITALARLGELEVAAGAVDAGLAHLDEAMAAATAGEGQDPQSIGEACCQLMEVAGLLGDMNQVGSWAAAVAGFRESYDFPPLAAYGPSTGTGVLSAFCGACCGGIYLVNGRLDDAEQELISAIESLEASQMHSRCTHPVTQLAELRVIQGRLAEARELLAAYEDLPECVRPLAALDLADNAADRGAARLRSGIDELRDQPVATFPLWTLLVDAEIARGDLAAADEAIAEVARVARLTGSQRHAAQAAFAEAKVAAAHDAVVAAPALREAARLMAAADLPLLACTARLAFARASLAGGDSGTAVAEARAALTGFERLGASSEADAAAGFLRELGVRGRTGPRSIGLLSKREQEVLRLVAEGLSNAEIADRLFISVKTAGHHVSNILSKLQLRSRTEAAAYALLNLSREPVVK